MPLSALNDAVSFQRLTGEPTAAYGPGAERVIALGRAFLATAGLVAVWVDPTEPARYVPVAYSLLSFYVVFAILTLGLVWRRPQVLRSTAVVLHTVDVLCASSVSLFTLGPSSPYFALVVFVVVAAAWRWGLRPTLVTLAILVGIFALQAAFLTGAWTGRPLVEGTFELNRFMVRIAYLMVLGLFIGSIAEEERRARMEAATIATIVGRVRAERGVYGALDVVLGDISRLFKASTVFLPIKEAASGRVFVWQWSVEPPGPRGALRHFEPAVFDRDTYSTEWPDGDWLARRGRTSDEPWSLVKLTGEPSHGEQSTARIPDRFLARHPCQAILSVGVSFEYEWTGRVVMLDPSVGARPLRVIRFARELIRRLAPPGYNVYLVRRLRSRAQSIERARVARELHDGVIQGLVGIEMHMEALRRRGDGLDAHLAELDQLQGRLHGEILTVRDLMRQLHPPDLQPRQLLEYLSGLVERFRHDTGIEAVFVSDTQDVSLSSSMCREVAQIVRESLVNVRKHAGARHVVVRFGSDSGHWTIGVDDDGRGFDFDGRLSQAELDVMRKGPLVIKERLRTIGGELTVESHPGRGARLQIRVPRWVHG